MLNGLAPDAMTSEQRLAETVSLLAMAFLRIRHRLCQPRNRSNFSSLTDNSLDFRHRQSVDAGVSGDLENPHAR